MKVLVTGGAGYIGSTTCSALLDAGHIPIILDSFVTGRREFVKDRIFYEGDIADDELIKKIISEHPDIDCCIHFAARIIIPESVENPFMYYTENVVKSIKLFHSLKRHGIKKIIFSSSASLYKTIDSFMVTEKSELCPLSPYARTKMAMEMVLEDFCNADYFKGISLRYFNPIGADVKMRTGPFVPQPSHILGKLVNTALGIESEFSIAGIDWPTRDGTAIRDYLHVWDLANAHVLAVEKFDDVFKNTSEQYTVINLGSGNGVTVKEFVDAFVNAFGGSINITYNERRPGDVAGAYANCQKARELLGWETKYTIEDAVKHMLMWTRDGRMKILGY